MHDIDELTEAYTSYGIKRFGNEPTTYRKISNTDLKVCTSSKSYLYRLYPDSGLVFQYELKDEVFIYKGTLYNCESIGCKTNTFILEDVQLKPIENVIGHVFNNVKEIKRVQRTINSQI